MFQSAIVILFSMSSIQASASELSGYGSPPADGQRVVLVTGSTGGLGRELARALAEEGDHVIVHGRSQERGHGLVDEILEAGGSARFYAADFGQLATVEALAEAVQRDYGRLDVLINNAGIALPGDRRLSEDGNELHFQVNYLAGYLLAEKLLPMLRRSDDARLVNVSSLGQAPVDFDDLTLDNEYSTGRAYSISKHAQIMHMLDLAADPANQGIRINALHPSSYMDTDMVIELGVEPQSSVNTGRDAVLQLVNGDVGSGDFYDVFEKAQARFEQAHDEAARERLRAITDALIEKALGADDADA